MQPCRRVRVEDLTGVVSVTREPRRLSGAALDETDEGSEDNGNRNSREGNDAVLNRPPPLA